MARLAAANALLVRLIVAGQRPGCRARQDLPWLQISAPRASSAGRPAHSRSPLIHNYWIRQHGIDGDYRKEAVPPEEFADFIAHLAEHGYVGANVTLPHKEAALALSSRTSAPGGRRRQHAVVSRAAPCARPTPTSRASSPISTPPRRDGIAVRRSAVVLGAGGSARAVVFGLIERGVGAHPCRQPHAERAQALHERFGAAVHAGRLGARSPACSRGAGLLVNTTSLGMNGPAAARPRCRPAARRRGGGRPGLCAAGNAAAGRGARARPAHRRRPRHAAAPGGARLFDCGSACVRR